MDFYTPEFNRVLGSKFDIKDFPLKREIVYARLRISLNNNSHLGMC